MKHAFKKTLAMLLVLAMVIGVIPSVFAAKVATFTDVDEADWFAPFVEYVYEHDPQLMNGTSATTFEPEGTCTRAMAAVVLYRLADPVIPSIKPSTFTDLTQDWYKNGIAWAQQKGVVNGVGGNRFDPDGLVTREQLVTMLWRYAGSPKVEGDFLKGFPDANQIADYAKEAFNWAISMKIIAGSDGKLLPKDNATRAQFAKIISVFDEATKPCEEHMRARLPRNPPAPRKARSSIPAPAAARPRPRPFPRPVTTMLKASAPAAATSSRTRTRSSSTTPMMSIPTLTAHCLMTTSPI